RPAGAAPLGGQLRRGLGGQPPAPGGAAPVGQRQRQAKDRLQAGHYSEEALRELEGAWQAPVDVLPRLQGTWAVRRLAQEAEPSDPSRAVVGLYSSELGKLLGMDLAAQPEAGARFASCMPRMFPGRSKRVGVGRVGGSRRIAA
ncbi:unnamed protein product, partial [Prorocentrum cordatum]